MKGEFRAQLPGKVDGEYYIVRISYAGEGKFNGVDMENGHPRNVGSITEWDRIIILKTDAMTLGILSIDSDEKYNSLDELADAAFKNGMNRLARAYPHSDKYNNKEDSGV